MSLPPNLSPAELWAEITRQPVPHREIDFPRRDDDGKPICKLTLVVLTPTEQVQCAAAGERYCKELLGVQKLEDRGIGYKDIYDSAAATEFLFQSARYSPDINVKFFPSAQWIRDKLTADEVAVLVNAYEQLSAELGPIISSLSEVEMNAWLEKLALGAKITSPFYLLSSKEKNELLRFSAMELSRLRMVSSSPGGHAEASTQTSLE